MPPTHLHPLPLNATLEDRLDAFRNAPGIGWEPADFVNWNLQVRTNLLLPSARLRATQTCSNVVPNHNKDLLAKSSLIWAGLNSTAVIQHRERMARFLEDKKAQGAFSPIHVSQGGRGLIGNGRGFVFTAGNAVSLSTVIYF